MHLDVSEVIFNDAQPVLVWQKTQESLAQRAFGRLGNKVLNCGPQSIDQETIIPGSMLGCESSPGFGTGCLTRKV